MENIGNNDKKKYDEIVLIFYGYKKNNFTLYTQTHNHMSGPVEHEQTKQKKN